MAITSRLEHKISVVPPLKRFVIKEYTIVEKDGKEISRNYRNYVKNPGDDVSKEPADVQTAANKIWTTDVVNTYKASLS